jgi:predicted nucleic acid-binding protein
MYAAVAPHHIRDSCRDALEKAVRLKANLVTDSEVLQELLYRYFAINRPEVAESVYRSAVRLCDEVLPVSERHTARALELLLKYRRLSVRDAIHIATMEAKGLRRLVSTDKDFDGVSEIRRIDPRHFLA